MKAIQSEDFVFKNSHFAHADTHSQRGFDFKVLFQIEPPIFILEFHSKPIFSLPENEVSSRISFNGISKFSFTCNHD